jgi:hypothetical protein
MNDREYDSETANLIEELRKTIYREADVWERELVTFAAYFMVGMLAGPYRNTPIPNLAVRQAFEYAEEFQKHARARRQKHD